MSDPYTILGVERSATEPEIKKAYRRLAQKYHPDKDSGNEVKFKEAADAYDRIKKEQAQPNQPPPGFSFTQGAGHNSPFEDMEAYVRQAQAAREARRQAQPITVEVDIALSIAVNGGEQIVSIRTARTQPQVIQIQVPMGVSDGQTVLYPQMFNGTTDLKIRFKIKSDAVWERDEDDLIKTQELSVWDAILGCSMEVETITGRKVKITIPPRTQSGMKFRLKKLGLKSSVNLNEVGDMYVKVLITVPEQISDEIIKAIHNHRG